MKVSAYIPCCNNGPTVAQAVESVRRQDAPVAELFAIDDGSSDGSVEILQALGVRLLRNSCNLGRGAVRAWATREASHESILACDAGIALPPDFLRRALTWMREERVAAVFGPVQASAPRNARDRWRARHLFKAGSIGPLHRAASLATGGVLLRKSALLQVGNFAAGLRQSEDAELGRRLLAGGFEVLFDPELKVLALGQNSLRQLLERYGRWNAARERPPGLANYLKQVSYSIKVMAREDLRERDPASAAISFLCPHYMFWKTWLRRPARPSR